MNPMSAKRPSARRSRISRSVVLVRLGRAHPHASMPSSAASRRSAPVSSAASTPVTVPRNQRAHPGVKRRSLRIRAGRQHMYGRTQTAVARAAVGAGRAGRRRRCDHRRVRAGVVRLSRPHDAADVRGARRPGPSSAPAAAPPPSCSTWAPGAAGHASVRQRQCRLHVAHPGRSAARERRLPVGPAARRAGRRRDLRSLRAQLLRHRPGAAHRERPASTRSASSGCTRPCPSPWTGRGPSTLHYGLWPFGLGDLAKIFAAAAVIDPSAPWSLAAETRREGGGVEEGGRPRSG